MALKRSQSDQLPLLPTSSTVPPSTAKCSLPARYALAILLFFGLANVYALRINLSIAIVAMTHQPGDPAGVGEFHWNNNIQGVVLGSFFYGYILTQIPGGWLATRFGGKIILGAGVVTTTLLTLVTPVAARLSVWALVSLRVVEGIGEGVTFPAMLAIWSKWAPPAERSRLTTIAMAGPNVGTVVSMPISGWLCRNGFGKKSSLDYQGDEWPSVFYVFGCAGLVWCFLWFLLAADSPSSHRRISTSERHFILSSIQSEEKIKVKSDVPWKALLSSGPVWATVIAYMCGNVGPYVLLTGLPGFMKDVLGFDLVENGLYSALPYLVYAFLIPICGWLADYLRNNVLSTTAVRKIFTLAAFLLPPVFLLLASYTTSSSMAVVYLVLCVGLTSPFVAGIMINTIDIAPRYAGVLFGIVNTAGTLPGVLAPMAMKAMTALPHEMNDSLKEETLRQLWRQVFFVTAEIQAFGAIVYLIFGSGVVQPWAGGGQTGSASPAQRNTVQED